MSYQVGERFSAHITSHRLRTIGDKVAAVINFDDPGGNALQALIFLTEAARGMARGQLKACGFDIDKQDLYLLDDNQEMLAGNQVQIEADEYKNKMQYRVVIPDKPSKRTLLSLQSSLRKKKDGEKEPELDAAAVDDSDIPF